MTFQGPTSIQFDYVNTFSNTSLQRSISLVMNNTKTYVRTIFNLPILLFLKVLLIWNFLSKFGDELISITNKTQVSISLSSCSHTHYDKDQTYKCTAGVLPAPTACYATSRPHSCHVSKSDWPILDPRLLPWIYVVLNTSHVQPHSTAFIYIVQRLGMFFSTRIRFCVYI
jgi:hypothetical protein